MLHHLFALRGMGSLRGIRKNKRPFPLYIESQTGRVYQNQEKIIRKKNIVFFNSSRNLAILACSFIQNILTLGRSVRSVYFILV